MVETTFYGQMRTGAWRHARCVQPLIRSDVQLSHLGAHLSENLITTTTERIVVVVCCHIHNDVPLEPQRNVSTGMAYIRVHMIK